MGRPPSIPQALKDAILSRWLQDVSPEKIETWIKESNAYRQEHVQTSRSSIERVIADAQRADPNLAPLSIVLRMRRRAEELYATLNRVQEEYRKQWEDAQICGTVEEERAANLFSLRRIRTLQQQERLAIRMLRLAGLGGTASQSMLDGYKDRLKELESVAGAGSVEEAVVGFLDDSDEERTAALVAQAEAARQAEAVAATKAAEASEAASPSAESVRNEASDRPEEPVGGVFEASAAVPRPAPIRLVAPPRPASVTEIPFLKEPVWKPTPTQRKEWTDLKTLINRHLRSAWVEGVPAGMDPLVEPVPQDRSGTLGAQIAHWIPFLRIPPWVTEPVARAELVRQQRIVNGWIQWLRVRVEQRSGAPDAGGVTRMFEGNPPRERARCTPDGEVTLFVLDPDRNTIELRPDGTRLNHGKNPPPF